MARRTTVGLAAIASGSALFGAYVGVVTGAVAVDLGLGRRTRPLGPQTVDIAAPRELVFDIVAAPYLSRQPQAMAEKIEVLERGTEMVLAAHRTPVRMQAGRDHGGDGPLHPTRTGRLPTGPRAGAAVVEQFVLTATPNDRTSLTYTGQLGTDLWRLGGRWGDRVSALWERTVAASLESVKIEVERRAAARGL